MKKRVLSLLLAGILVFSNVQVLANEVEKEETPVTTAETENEVVADEDEKEEVKATKEKDEESKPHKYLISRIAGSDRYCTAQKATEAIMSSDIAVLASGENESDALFGGPLAVQVSGPILLTSKDKLPEGIDKTLKKLGTKFIYIIGGKAAVSEEVEAELKELGYGISRIAGKDRVETAHLINLKTAELRGVKVIGDLPSILVSGNEFADALSSAPFAQLALQNTSYSRFIPYSGYTKSDDLVIGGFSSVPSGEEKERIAGEDRYETALKIAEAHKKLLKEKKNLDVRRVVIVDGTNYPDALAAGPVASSLYAPILLTSPNKLHEGVAKFIIDNEIESVTIFGGRNSVSEDVESELRHLR